MPLAKKDSTPLKLQNGPGWSSFEKFRTEGAKALEGSIPGFIFLKEINLLYYRD